jgi:hypothetical protein
MAEQEGGRRVLPPRFTKGYTHVPQLREKLPWLYGTHPIVKTQYLLARELKVSPGTLSTWLSGVTYKDGLSVAPQNPDCIPTRHYRAFMAIWGLPDAILEMADLAAFKSALASFESGRGPWDRFVLALPDDEALEIVLNAEKGLIDPDDGPESGVLRLFAGDEIMLRLPSLDAAHGALLMQDRFGWSTLRPTARAPETALDGALVFPRQRAGGPARFAELDAVGGMHRAIAILWPEPPPAALAELLLAQPLEQGGLNRLAPLLQGRIAGHGCRVVSRRFMVSAARRRRRSSVALSMTARGPG